MPEPDWSCPFCGLVKMKYGSSCSSFKEGTCENMDKLNINGRWYLQRKEIKEGKSVGIAQISDEGM